MTVVIAAYNGMPDIERALDSLVRQTIGLDRMQVLVVDDCSTDETPAVLDRLSALHPEFEIIHRETNFGRPAGPRNQAVKLARGRYLSFLDQDDYYAEYALEAMVRAADENGTDVVAGRIRGIGGRGTPRSMFTRTVARADVFSSNLYWTLNPMKLFRTGLVRSLDLRFMEDSMWGEDEAFVATAYLKGNGISVLSDRDYIYWVFRDDLSNITTSVYGLADRMPAVKRMFDLVAANVPAGRDRDHLMRRHFQIELAESAFIAYRTDIDAGRRAEAFAEFRRIADAYYTDRIAQATTPEVRILMRLISEDREADFAAYLDALEQAGSPAALAEGDLLYLELPCFRAPGKGLPDELFEFGRQLKAVCQVQPLEVDGGVLLKAYCRLGALSDRVTDVSLIARTRGGETERVFSLPFETVLDETRSYAVVEGTVSASQLLGTTPAGVYELHLRVAAGAVWRETRITECAPPPAELRIVRHAGTGGTAITAALSTMANDTLSLRVVAGAPSAAAMGLRCRVDRSTDLIANTSRRIAGRLRRMGGRS